MPAAPAPESDPIYDLAPLSGRMMESLDFEAAYNEILRCCLAELNRSGDVAPFVFAFKMGAPGAPHVALQRRDGSDLFTAPDDQALDLATGWNRVMLATGEADLSGYVVKASGVAPEDGPGAARGQRRECVVVSILSTGYHALGVSPILRDAKAGQLERAPLQFVGSLGHPEGVALAGKRPRLN